MKTIPTDIKAYMTAAAIEIATEKKYIPASKSDLMDFMETNKELIVNRASKNMWSLFAKMSTTSGQKVKNVLAATVWRKINTGKINRETNTFLADVLA